MSTPGLNNTETNWLPNQNLACWEGSWAECSLLVTETELPWITLVFIFSSKNIQRRFSKDSYMINKYFHSCIITQYEGQQIICPSLLSLSWGSFELHHNTVPQIGLLCATMPVRGSICQLSIHNFHICNIFKISSRLLHTSYTQNSLYSDWGLYRNTDVCISGFPKSRKYSLKLNFTWRSVSGLLKKLWQNQDCLCAKVILG